jgi:hypothetical protein
MNRLIIISSIFLLLSPAAAGQEVRVSASFDTTRVYMGDHVHYTVTIDQPSGLRLNVRTLKDTLCKNIEILSGPVSDTIFLAGERLKITGRYLVTSFDSGSYLVPPVFAEIENDSVIRRFYSGYSPLRVERVSVAPADTAREFFDIIEPVRAPLTPGEIIPWALAFVVAAALSWEIFLYARKLLSKRKMPEMIINPDPAHVTAFRDLGKLKDEQLWQKGEVKKYYSMLTEILRRYLENRYGVCSLEMTTSETLEALVKWGFRKDESYSLLKAILNGADLVKFAKYRPLASENEAHLENSWKFVEATMEKEEMTPAGDQAGKMEDA